MTLSRLQWPLLVLAVLCLILAPIDLTPFGLPWQGLRPSKTILMSRWLVFAIAAMGVNLIVGYAGQETLAQAAFLGVGAYLTAITTKWGLPFGVAFVASGLLCFVIGIILGFPALRVQKHYLAFVTLAFTIFLWLVFRNEEWLTGGTFGISRIPRPSLFGVPLKASTPYEPDLYFYWFTLALTGLLTFGMWWLVRSPWGRAFTALRENATRAESLGIDVRGYKLMAFAIGSAYGGFAGSIFAALNGSIDPNAFDLGVSLLFMLMVVIGGAGTMIGPFLGAFVNIVMRDWLEVATAKITNPLLSHFLSYLLVYAIIVIIMMAFCPTGIVGLFQRLTTRARRPHADDKGPTLGANKGATTVAGAAS